MRHDNRKHNELRKLSFKQNFTKYADGSVLISMGETKVICNASIEDKVPPHLRGKRTGWVTADYAMLPRSAHTRTTRQRSFSCGRTQEIQRLIGRSLRAITDLNVLGERTITLDCDVIQADGGTRTASVSGAYVALYIAIKKLYKHKLIDIWPLKDTLAAVSVGIVKNKPLLDLCYIEDVNAEVDMNVVMTGTGKFVEIQGTGEEATFDDIDLSKMLKLAKKGIIQITEMQKRLLKI